jgi:hypothetical protein
MMAEDGNVLFITIPFVFVLILLSIACVDSFTPQGLTVFSNNIEDRLYKILYFFYLIFKFNFWWFSYNQRPFNFYFFYKKVKLKKNESKKREVKHGCYSLTKETLLSLNFKNNTDIYINRWNIKIIEGNCYRLNFEDKIEKFQGAN